MERLDRALGFLQLHQHCQLVVCTTHGTPVLKVTNQNHLMSLSAGTITWQAPFPQA
jgi:hypothetical protein